MRSYSSLSMKFLLAIGLVSTGFSLFLIHQTWKINNESLHQMLSEQAELAMAFDVAMQEVNQKSDKNKDNKGLDESLEICNFGPESVKAVFGKVQATNPQTIIYSTGKQLSKILNQSQEGQEIYAFYVKNPTLESLDKVVTFNGLKYLAKCLKIPPASLEILSGQSSRTKRILLHYENDNVSESEKKSL